MLYLWLLLLSLIARPVYGQETLVTRAVADYQYHIDQFRAKYDAFTLARSQYEAVSTFANQETLADAARNMLVWRDKVWWTYFQAVRTDVTTSLGFDETVKQELEAELLTEQEGLKTHEEEVSTKTTVVDLLNSAKGINDKQKPFASLSYRALYRIRIARLRDLATDLQRVREQIVSAVEVQVRDARVREERGRGLVEVNEIIGQAMTDLDEAEKIFGQKNRWESNPVSVYSE
jgi:hypothetical protein